MSSSRVVCCCSSSAQPSVGRPEGLHSPSRPPHPPAPSPVRPAVTPVSRQLGSQWIQVAVHKAGDNSVAVPLSKSLLGAIAKVNSGEAIIKDTLCPREAVGKRWERPTPTPRVGFSRQASPQSPAKVVPNQIREGGALALWDLKATKEACPLPKALFPGADHKGHPSLTGVQAEGSWPFPHWL